MKNKIVLILHILSLLGILFSGITIYDHYNTEPSSVCLTGGGCDTANDSVYSEFMGIPVGFFGILWFILFSLSISFNEPEITTLLILGGVTVVAYFIFVELYILRVICSTCTFIHAIVYLQALIVLAPFMSRTFKRNNRK
ncbi:MAG: vitamin K epoxide reductase family protein [Candidatus Woesearchaeota archaeon]|jgi:uncharacterized membrane protein